MMNKLAVRTGLSTLALTLAAFAAVAQLNPTVKVLSTPTSSVPVECIEGQAPQTQPRAEVAQIPEAPKRKPMAAPPSASLRGLLEDTQAAAARGDRVAFRETLSRAKGMLENYATGGERTVATEAIALYEDLDRIWSYQFDTPTGAFFDAGTIPAEIMRKYSGYEKAIASQVFVDSNGHRYYPTVETREYLLRSAAQLLTRLGVSVAAPPVRESHVVPRTTAPAKSAETTTHATTRPATHETKTSAKASTGTQTTTASKSTTHSTKPTSHKTAAATHSTKTAVKASAPPAEKTAAKSIEKPAVKTAPVVAAPKKSEPVAKVAEGTSGSMTPKHTETAKPTETPKQAETPKHVETPKPAALPTTSPTPAEAKLPPPAATLTAATTTTAPPSPAASSSPTPAVPVATPATTATSATTPIPTDTSATAAVATDTTSTVAKEAKGKSVILPIVLIVIGLGVLIVLFRASS